MNDSRLSGLYKLAVRDRIAELQRRGWLSENDAHSLKMGRHVLPLAAADSMIENVIGVFGLPLAIAPNFVVNKRDYIVPLVVEEPSVVAALGSAAAMARDGGGFHALCDESLLAGQIHIAGVADAKASMGILTKAKGEFLTLADAVHPRLQARGGGVRDIEFRILQLADGATLIVVHVLVDTADAMGANLVNTICESIAPKIAAKVDGDIALRILSNLTDRSVVTASVRFTMSALQNEHTNGELVRDNIVMASAIASADPYRAATHNKGVMNGVDALAIATGNDWRAIEAGVHAYAARSGQYTSITRWSVGDNGDLLGEIEIPLKLGVVGGTLSSNPAAEMCLAMTAVESARELSELMAAVGLAQNFSALKALTTSGIQAGHMRLHARSVASAIGAPKEHLDELSSRLVASGEIKTWKAQEILRGLKPALAEDPASAAVATAAGKIILFGEHAVVYGRSALAIPIPNAVSATVALTDAATVLIVPDWNLQISVDVDSRDGVAAAVSLIVRQLNIARQNFKITVSSSLPRGMGLGSSAAIAVAITRAIACSMDIDVSDAKVNDIALECEKLAHGTPSGIDNTVSCYAQALLFRKAATLNSQIVHVDEAPPLVVGFSHDAGMTHEQVVGVRQRRNLARQHYDAIFDQMNDLSLAGVKALEARKYTELGELLNVCHGLLNAIQVSTPDIENMLTIARQAGALGAKLTGAGGGGAILALCPGRQAEVHSALQGAGYRTLQNEAFKID